ncbi:MAG: hypothetical protein GY743_12990, partial [Planctomycetaceae bacterium]|nr:hypothetical protein [Planctomycetaceae bacterium]
GFVPLRQYVLQGMSPKGAQQYGSSASQSPDPDPHLPTATLLQHASFTFLKFHETTIEDPYYLIENLDFIAKPFTIIVVLNPLYRLYSSFTVFDTCAIH